MIRPGRHVRGERDTSWSRRVKLRGRGHLRERGEQERQRDHGKQRMGGRALRWEVDTLEGRTFGARVVSRPGVPGKGRRGSEGGEKQGLREGRTKGEAETRTYGTEWNLTRDDGGERK